jgi:hypothetical protein
MQGPVSPFPYATSGICNGKSDFHFIIGNIKMVNGKKDWSYFRIQSLALGEHATCKDCQKKVFHSIRFYANVIELF